MFPAQTSISAEGKDQPLLLPKMLLSFSLLLFSHSYSTAPHSDTTIAAADVKNINQFLVALNLFFCFGDSQDFVSHLNLFSYHHSLYL